MIGLSKADTAAIVVMGTRDSDFPDAVAEAHWLAGALGAERLIVEEPGTIHMPGC